MENVDAPLIAGEPLAPGIARSAPRSRHVVIALAVALVIAALGALGWIGSTPPPQEAREQQHVIPKGTWSRRMAGQDVEILPQTIRLTLGVEDVLVLVNHDDVPQQFGPVLMMPGQTFRLPFAVASEYQFACTAHVSGYLTVVVDPSPPWWTLLFDRVAKFARRMA